MANTCQSFNSSLDLSELIESLYCFNSPDDSDKVRILGVVDGQWEL